MDGCNPGSREHECVGVLGRPSLMHDGPVTHSHGAFQHAHAHDRPHRHMLHPRRSRSAGAAVHSQDRRSAPLADGTYRRLFAAQVVALVGSGISTVALGLLAYDLAGANASVVLGAALALKMVAYVGLPPVVTAVASRVPRRRLLVALDLGRAAIVLCLPFVTEVWQVLALIFVMSACSAGFTPAFQATIPDVLPREDTYTRALSLSRLAYDLQELISPVLAAGLLLVMTFDGLFALNAIGFLTSALLVASTRLPEGGNRAEDPTRVLDRVTVGIRRFMEVPRLRGLLALSLAAAAGSAMVLVNTVVLVRDELMLGPTAVAIALAAAGGGSMVAALTLPAILTRVSDRAVMLSGGALIAAVLAVLPSVTTYPALLVSWVTLGVGLSLVQTPVGRLIRRSGRSELLPDLFAAQFSLSHACWLLTYPLAGIVGTVVGLDAIALALAVIAAVATTAAATLWPDERQPHR